MRRNLLSHQQFLTRLCVESNFRVQSVGDNVVRQCAMESGVEACDLRNLRLLAQQKNDGLQRERLVEWREGDAGRLIAQHGAIDAYRNDGLTTAMHHVVGYGAIPAAGNVFQNELQHTAIRMFRVKWNAERWNTGFAKVRGRHASGWYLAVPQRPAWQWINGSPEDGKLDARRVAFQDQSQGARCCIRKGTRILGQTLMKPYRR